MCVYNTHVQYTHTQSFMVRPHMRSAHSTHVHIAHTCTHTQAHTCTQCMHTWQVHTHNAHTPVVHAHSCTCTVIPTEVFTSRQPSCQKGLSPQAYFSAAVWHLAWGCVVICSQDHSQTLSPEAWPWCSRGVRMVCVCLAVGQNTLLFHLHGAGGAAFSYPPAIRWGPVAQDAAPPRLL